mgnify:FL=1
MAYFPLSLIGFGIPIGVVWFLRKHKKDLANPEFKMKYGFLYDGYRISDRYYW